MKKRQDGRYLVRVSVEDEYGVKRRVPCYGNTQREARRKAEQVRAKALSGSPVRDDSRTLSEWLDEWGRDYLKVSDLKPTTRAQYTTLLRVHVVPAIGHIPMSRLRTADVVRMLGAMTDAGKSESTRRSCYAALRGALNDAVANKVMRENPVLQVKRPGRSDREARSLTQDEVAKFLAGAQDLRYLPAYRLALRTGLRRAELAGLRWDDVDWEREEIKVARNLVRVGPDLIVTTPKSRRSRRTVPLDEPRVALLKKHKADQAAERLAAGEAWEDSDHVFVTHFGRPVDPNNLSRGVRLAVRKAAIPEPTADHKIGMHTLRHTFASALLLDGVPLFTVSRLLGHSSIAITADIYGHVTDDALRDAVSRGSEVLGL